MFGYNYKLRVVNPSKGVVKLTPTVGTYVKVFAPSFVIFGLVMLAGVIAEKNEMDFVEDTNED